MTPCGPGSKALFIEKWATDVNKSQVLSEQGPYLGQSWGKLSPFHHPANAPDDSAQLSEISHASQRQIWCFREWKDSDKYLQNQRKVHWLHASSNPVQHC